MEEICGLMREDVKTNSENRLVIRKGADICVELLARIRPHDGIEERLRAGDEVGRNISNCHLVRIWSLRLT
jgi:hypothetical protein